MEAVSVVKADAKGRVTLRSEDGGQRFIAYSDDGNYILERVKPVPRVKGSRVIRERGLLVGDTEKPITRETLAKTMEDCL